jgi:flavin reductase (DIM6/NTAB) family NADH-FMN oxidoreductase RutF
MLWREDCSTRIEHKRPLPLAEVYRLIEPGPVVLLTTAFKRRPNVMTMSWHMMIDFEPPLIGCIVSNRNYSFDILKTTQECVINIPTKEVANKVVKCGNTSGRTVDKFKRFHLTPVAASAVSAPLVDECYANLECRVVDATMTAKYNLFILEVVQAWIDPSNKDPRTIHHLGKGVFMFAGDRVRLRSGAK